MSLLFRVIYASGCRNTHHKFALDALRYLQHDEGAQWRKLFLKYHGVYLEGAKAPDAKFRDFRNHVLHVQDDYWGGAPEAARRWYETTVEALATKRWKAAIYNAGVLSHYYTDVTHPFHTDQSQAESNIHRAAEWTIFKSYSSIYRLATTKSYFQDVPVPEGDTWLQQMVRQAAEAANPYYETLVNRFDFDIGVDAPASGYDAPCREILAKLFGHAIVGFARILDRAFAEAAVQPPDVDVSLRGVLELCASPARWMTKRIAGARERAAVESIYRELQRTGTVDRNLPEDDRVIRDLHAKEMQTRTASASPPSWAGSSADHVSIGEEVASENSRGALATRLRFHLQMTDDTEEVPAIGPEVAQALADHGVQTVRDLLAADPVATAEALCIDAVVGETVQDWQDQARLVCHIPKLRGHDAQILVACGYRQVDEIANADPDKLLAEVEPLVDSEAGQQILRSGNRPDLQEVSNWIAWSQRARFLRAA